MSREEDLDKDLDQTEFEPSPNDVIIEDLNPSPEGGLNG